MPKDYKNIIIFIAIIFILICGALFYFFEIKKTQEARLLFEKLSPNLLDQNIDRQTLACLDKVPVEANPQIGLVKFQKTESFTDYFYRVHLKSVEQVEIDGCGFVKLSMTYEPKSDNIPFELYLPKNMPSPGTNKTILPQELSQYLDKRLQIKVRYWIDPSSSNPDSIKGILGWQLEIIFDN